ncbi:type VII secretion target [Actinosynnema sp. NPDC023587]|uniref:type VII secretion target n=1 Tax=Actinosynnema sp. NPDC023587 TaxID=3154695 RepID=UPI0033D17FE7
MSDGFTVDSEELATHATTVDGFAGRADTATDAGSHVAGLDDAYGLLCRPFASLLKEPQQRGVDTLGDTASLLHDMVGGLDDCAKTYQEAEAKVEAVMKALLAQLDAVASAPVIRGGR